MFKNVILKLLILFKLCDAYLGGGYLVETYSVARSALQQTKMRLNLVDAWLTYYTAIAKPDEQQAKKYNPELLYLNPPKGMWIEPNSLNLGSFALRLRYIGLIQLLTHFFKWTLYLAAVYIVGGTQVLF